MIEDVWILAVTHNGLCTYRVFDKFLGVEQELLGIAEDEFMTRYKPNQYDRARRDLEARGYDIRVQPGHLIRC